MKLYNLNSKLDFGEYRQETLKEIFLKDPEYIEECILDIPTFCFNPGSIDTLEDMHPEFSFSEEAVNKLDEKYDIYEDEENNFDDMENFSEEDLKNFGIMEDDDFDGFDNPGDFYEDNFGY